MKISLIVFWAICIVTVVFFTSSANAFGQAKSKTAAKAEALTALDKLEIMELAARFETALDAEDEKDFLATFIEDGELIAFGAASKGRKGSARQFLSNAEYVRARQTALQYESDHRRQQSGSRDEIVSRGFQPRRFGARRQRGDQRYGG